MGGDRCQLSSQGRNWTPDLVTRDYLLFGNNGQNPWAHSFLSGVTYRIHDPRRRTPRRTPRVTIPFYFRPLQPGDEKSNDEVLRPCWPRHYYWLAGSRYLKGSIPAGGCHTLTTPTTSRMPPTRPQPSAPTTRLVPISPKFSKI